jgi:tetratricopeptide (TPR) repeat protein
VKALAILVVLLGVAHAEPKRKQAPDKFTKAAGEAFNAAVKADTSGDLRTALAMYQKAHAIAPHPSTVYNIGDVERRLGNLKEAIRHLETYLVMSPDAKDRADVEATIDALWKTPGTLQIITEDPDRTESLDLPAGFVLVDGEIKKRPGAVPTIKPRGVPAITLQVTAGEHVVDFVTPLTYASRECDVEPGGTTWCQIKAEPRIDGNVVVSSSDRRLEVTKERRGKRLVFKRFEMPAGKQRLMIEDRNWGCPALPIEVSGGNTVSYSFLGTAEYDGLRRCRTFDIKQHRLQFDP